MNGSRLTLGRDEDEQVIWLITKSSTGIMHRDLVRLRESFSLDDVRSAVLATGWVSQDGDELRFTSAFDRHRAFDRSLSDVVEDMFSYFNSPEDPTDELLEVQSAVAQYEGTREARSDIPLYAYAWLDLMIREAVADEARSATGIWSKSTVALNIARSRDRRVEEFLSRYSQSEPRVVGRMAESLPTRKPDASRDAKTG